MKNGSKCWRGIGLSGWQTGLENTIPKTSYEARYVNPSLKQQPKEKA